MRARYLVAASVALSACGAGDASIELRFPSDTARDATKLLSVYAFNRDASIGVDEARCDSLFGKLASGTLIPGEPVDNPFEPPFDGRQIAAFPSGDPVIFVVAFDSVSDDRHPIMEGCTEVFDSGGNAEDVPIDLQVIFPDDVRMVKSGGDRQVARPGEPLPNPLEVLVTATLPNMQGIMYPLPGVEVTFVPSGDVSVGTGAGGAAVSAFTDARGKAALPVTLPAQGGDFRVEARGEERADVPPLAFSVAGSEPMEFRVSTQIALGGRVRRTIAIAAGDVVGGPEPDVVVLGCDGDPAHCALGVAAENPPGAAQVAVVDDILGGGAVVSPIRVDLGLAPSGLALANMLGDGKQEIAFINARHDDGVRVREGSQLRVLTASQGTLTLGQRYILTSSNAVGLRSYRVSGSSATHYDSVVTVAQGRRVDARPCRHDAMCLPDANIDNVDCVATPELCGCPVNEHCGCEPSLPCASGGNVGLCVADDNIVEAIIGQRSGPGFAKFACTQPVYGCVKPNDTGASRCSCADNPQNSCSDRDVCNCRVPTQTLIGVAGNTRRPHAFAVGPLTHVLPPPEDRPEARAPRNEIVAATIGGLDFMRHVEGGRWKWRSQPLGARESHGVEIAYVDSEDEVLDVVWFSRAACATQVRNDPCPIVGEVDGTRGCVGVRRRVESSQVDDFLDDGCRRYALPAEPRSMCVGDLNGDGNLDIAVSTDGEAAISVLAGSASGGMQYPPTAVPVGAQFDPGPLVCIDLDGDGAAEIVAADREGGDLIVLRVTR